MPTSSAGATSNLTLHCGAGFYPARGFPTRARGVINNQSGITLLEMLIVVGLVALLAGLTYPSVNAGLDTLRLRSASDQVVGFFSSAIDRADRRQQVVELQVLMTENALLARTADQTFVRRLQVPDPARIVSVVPPLAGSIAPNAARRFLLYPGGAIPAIGVEIATPNGRRRVIHLDPITGTARAEALTP